jgi:hypothetical protein
MKDNKSVRPAKNKKIISQPAAIKKAVKKTIENHKLAAAHHLEAAKHHEDAAKHYEEGNYEKAAHSTLLANGHNAIAGEFVSDDAKHHAQVLKRTNYRF